MYKIIVVDDEDDVRQAIVETVDWQSEGYELAGQARNGREALELYDALLPDAVLTDINMPYVTGLELLEQLNTRLPRPKVLLLTAYDEFECAQKAVKLNAVEYILKPVTRGELTQVLRSLKQAMDAEAAERENVDRLKREFEQSLPVLRERLLTLLLTTQPDVANLQEKLRVYGMDNLLDKCVMAGVLSADVERLDEHEFSVMRNADLIRFALCNIAGEVLAEHGMGFAFVQGDHVVALGLSGNGKACEQELLGVFDQIRCSVKKYLDFTVTVGAGYAVNGVEDIHFSYQGALSACNYKMVLGADRVIYIGDQEPPHGQGNGLDGQAEKELTLLIRSGNINGADELVDRLFHGITLENNASCEVFVMELLVTILKTARSIGVDTDGLYGGGSGILKRLPQMSDLDMAKVHIKDLLKQVTELAQQVRLDSNSRIIAGAKEYVDDHFMDSDVSIEKICGTLHVSSSHFCALFKKETGETFLSYLNRYRMDKAKELIVSTDRSMNEIANGVGYADPNYFSFSFKKMWGVTPREYRNSGKANG